MNYSECLKAVPATLTGDSLWKMEAYRLALFAADLAWRDVTKLMQDKRTLDLAGQLYRTIGSIGANLSEGYSRASSRDRARFYEHSLGSAREARTWYFDARAVLGELVVTHRMDFLTQIRRLLLTMVPEQRSAELHEEAPTYGSSELNGVPPELLVKVPMP